MLQFSFVSNDVVMTYDGDSGEQIIWVWESLNKFQTVCISRIFNFQLQDLRNPPSTVQDFNDYEYSFNFGTLNNEYITVPGRILSINRDVLIHKSIKLERKVFASERNVSIFGRLSKLLDHTNPIIIGGDKSEAIPKAYSRSCKVNSPTQGTGSLC